MADLRSATAESSAHVKCGLRAVTKVFGVIVRKLETRLVNRSCVNDCGLGQLDDLRTRSRRVATFGQRKTSGQAVILDAVVIVAVARDQSIFCVKGIVDARTQISESPGHDKALTNLEKV